MRAEWAPSKRFVFRSAFIYDKESEIGYNFMVSAITGNQTGENKVLVLESVAKA